MLEINEKQKIIIHAAMKIFTKDGFHKAKVSEIASEAGVGKGTIYEYFESKEELFLKMLEYYADFYFNKLVEATKKQETIMDQLKTCIFLEEKFIKKYGDLAHIFVREAQSIGMAAEKMMRSKRVQKIEFVADIMRDGIKQGIFRNIDPYLSALVFLGSIHQILVSKFFIKDDFSKEMEIESLYDTLFNGMKH